MIRWTKKEPRPGSMYLHIEFQKGSREWTCPEVVYFDKEDLAAQPWDPERERRSVETITLPRKPKGVSHD